MLETVSKKSIFRLSSYRRELQVQLNAGEHYIYSHQLAELSGASAAQVRRDLMIVGTEGSSSKGYDIKKLLGNISTFLDGEKETRVVLFGVGNLGKSLLQFYLNRRPNLKIVAAFETDEVKSGRVMCGVHCYPVSQAREIIDDLDATLAIVAVPAAAVSDISLLIGQTSIRGVLNFTPAHLQLGPMVEVVDLDITSHLEGLACMVRSQ